MMRLLTFIALIAAGSVWAVVPQASAATLQNRSINIGTSTPSATTDYDVTFAYATAGTAVGWVVLEFCTNDPFIGTSCTVPAGLDLSSATFAQTGETGFTVDGSSTANRIVLQRTPANPSVGPLSTYSLGGITNPSTPSQSVYLRISTHEDSGGIGAVIDQGGVVYSTSGAIGVNAYVPPYLTFCAGTTVAADCSSSTNIYGDMGILGPTQTGSTTSQFAAFTNDDQGYDVTVVGTTMTSGNNELLALSTAASQVGVSQFGINLRANSQPSVGAEITGTGSGVALAGYDTANQYRFVSGETIARSSLPTASNVYTVSYIANVSDAQPPGVYSTTLTFIGTAQF